MRVSVPCLITDLQYLRPLYDVSASSTAAQAELADAASTAVTLMDDPMHKGVAVGGTMSSSERSKFAA